MSQLIQKYFDKAIAYLSQQTPGRCRKYQLKSAIRKCFDRPMFVISHRTSQMDIDRTFCTISNALANWKPGTLPYLFVAYVWTDYHLRVIKDFHSYDTFCKEELESFLEMTYKFVEFQKEELHVHGLEKVLRYRLHKACFELQDLIRSLFFPNFQQNRCKGYLDIYKEELIQKTCHPSRVEWWTDFEEYNELFGHFVSQDKKWNE